MHDARESDYGDIMYKRSAQKPSYAASGKFSNYSHQNFSGYIDVAFDCFYYFAFDRNSKDVTNITVTNFRFQASYESNHLTNRSIIFYEKFYIKIT